MSWIRVDDFEYPAGWAEAPPVEERTRWYCQLLERGEILFFGRPPFKLPENDREFLLRQRPGSSRIHKNVSYRPHRDLLRGFPSSSPGDRDRMHEIMREYSRNVTGFLAPPGWYSPMVFPMPSCPDSSPWSTPISSLWRRSCPLRTLLSGFLTRSVEGHCRIEILQWNQNPRSINSSNSWSSPLTMNSFITDWRRSI